MVSDVILLGLFLATACGIMVRPFGLGPGWVATGAVFLATAAGLVTPPEVVAAVGRTGDVLLFFAGLLLLAASAARAGLFGLLLRLVDSWAGGSPRRLLVAVAVGTALVTVALSNDAAVLLFAPAVLRLVRGRRLPPGRFILAMAFMANSASLVLPMGNPVNLLILDRAGVSAAGYVAALSLPALAGVALLLALLALVAGRARWPATPVPPPGPAEPADSPDRRLVAALALILVALAVVDAAAALRGAPLGPPTATAGAVAAVAVLVRERGRLAWLRDGAMWSLLPLILGLSVLAAGLGGRGPVGAVVLHLSDHATTAAQATVVGMATAGLAALLNNLPAAVLMTTGLQAAHHLHQLAMPVIAGADLGPNLAPMGSLSTLLLFGVARRQGLAPQWRRFWRWALVAGPVSAVPVLLLVAHGH